MANFFRSLFRGAPADRETHDEPVNDDRGDRGDGDRGGGDPGRGNRGEPPARARAAGQATGGTVLDAEMTTRLARALVVLGTELWRARAKMPKNAEGADGRALKVVESSLDKMNAAVESLGLRHDDATGRTWDERDPFKVLVFEETAGLLRPKVLEVVKPTLYLGETLLSAGEVVVGVPEGSPRDDSDRGGVEK